MNTFFDWLTDSHNYARLQRNSGQRKSDLHKEICRLINNKHNTSWTEAQVKAKITYAMSKYREAAALSSADANTRGHHVSERPSKRRKNEGLTPAVLSGSIDKIQLFVDQAKAELRSREQAVESRKRELYEKLLRIADEAKRADESRDRLRLELAAERAKIKKEMAEFKASERAEIRQEKEDLNRDKSNFTNERVRLIAEIAALKRELEIIPKCEMAVDETA
ncbi:hypothetical protein EC991_007466 [Linnemannia zychae]|nr:hypothetical protein EC991_007466 [Linnemannia zychae]